MTSLRIAEVFGPTFQGEGPSTGRRASFIRLGDCNLACTWCDTPYTWDDTRFDLTAEITPWDAEDVADRALDGKPGLVVITGGEPLIQQRRAGFEILLGRLAEARVEVEVETNGTIAPTQFVAGAVTRFNVSPKLEHAGGDAGKRIRPDALAQFARLAGGRRASFKFVVSGPDDLDEVNDVVTAAGIPAGAVWIMPEGTTPEALAETGRAIADPVLDRGWNLTSRLHVQLWGQERNR